jgi:hypothetical protein
MLTGYPSSVAESPPRSVVDICTEFGRRGRDACTTLSSWGIEAAGQSRLSLALARLDELARTGYVSPDPDAIRRDLRALWISSDFAEIAETLPPRREKALRREITTALQGDLWPTSGSRQPLQLQSQCWLRAILVKAGLQPQSIPFSSKKPKKAPEFFLENGNTWYGIEVKRPERAQNVPAALADAQAKFVSQDCHGGVIIEASDCLEAVAANTMEASVRNLACDAFATIWEGGRGFRPGFDKIMYIGLIARGHHVECPSAPQRLRSAVVTSAAHFAVVEGTLLDHRAHWLHGEVLKAFELVRARMADTMPERAA